MRAFVFPTNSQVPLKICLANTPIGIKGAEIASGCVRHHLVKRAQTCHIRVFIVDFDDARSKTAPGLAAAESLICKFAILTPLSRPKQTNGAAKKTVRGVRGVSPSLVDIASGRVRRRPTPNQRYLQTGAGAPQSLRAIDKVLGPGSAIVSCIRIASAHVLR